MPPKRNPLNLNKLQLRTLTLAQVLAADPTFAQRDEATGDVTLTGLPHAHGDHFHIGEFTVSARDASGLTNPSVWVALQRKGLARIEADRRVTVTAAGLAYDTGLMDRLQAHAGHAHHH
jgi:hypothetical protein